MGIDILTNREHFYCMNKVFTLLLSGTGNPPLTLSRTINTDDISWSMDKGLDDLGRPQIMVVFKDDSVVFAVGNLAQLSDAVEDHRV
jgi:hypothetical protein